MSSTETLDVDVRSNLSAGSVFESAIQTALYDAALKSGAVETPFSILPAFMRQPFPEQRVAVYRCPPPPPPLLLHCCASK